jgi:transglutaminase-like putative cysteine protease
VVIAVVAPAFISSDRSNLLSNLVHDGTSANAGAGFGAGDGTGGIDPFAALTGQLTRHKAVNLFTATVTGGTSATGAKVQPFYARQNVLSVFNGKGWVVGNNVGTAAPLAEGYPSSPGTPRAPDSVDFTANISIKSLRSNPPTFAQPNIISGLDRTTAWDSQEEVLVGSTTQKNDDYTVTFDQPNPTVDELNDAVASDPSMNYYLKLPTIDPYVHTVVSTIISGYTTPYEKARAISFFFADPNNHFEYSLSTPPGDSQSDLVNFLQNRTGFCQQYAAAMAVMLRLANVPSRVVLGYTHKPTDSKGSFTVTTDDAHSWVEAYFTGIGWVPFDPTPLSGLDGGAQGDLAWAKHTGTILPTSPTNSSSAAGPTVSRPHTTAAGTASATQTASTGSHLSIAPAIDGGIAVIVLAILSTPAFARWRRRRGRLRRVRHGDTDALWTELSDTATDLGYLWSPARTPRQVAEWLREPAGRAASSLSTLTNAVEVSRYAPSGVLPSGQATGRDLAKEFSTVRSALGARLSWWDRMRARIWPASLGWTDRISGGRWNVAQLRTGRRRR